MSQRALQVPPLPGCDFSLALVCRCIYIPLCQQGNKSVASFLVASEHWTVHRILTLVCKSHTVHCVMTRVMSFKKIGLNALAPATHHGYRMGLIGLRIRIGKFPPNHSYREQHRRSAPLAVNLVMENRLVHDAWIIGLC